MQSKIAADQWLSLSQASRLLGVHASTLRRWADTGKVACQRTPGGHRRFSRRRMMQMLEGSGSEAAMEATAGLAAPWHQAYEQAGLVEDLREVGQRLAGIVMQFLLRDDNDERYLAEARAAAEAYARRSMAGGIGLRDAVGAFLYYRGMYVDLAAQTRGGGSEASPGGRSLARYELLMGQVLIALIAEYERARA